MPILAVLSIGRLLKIYLCTKLISFIKAGLLKFWKAIILRPILGTNILFNFFIASKRSKYVVREQQNNKSHLGLEDQGLLVLDLVNIAAYNRVFLKTSPPKGKSPCPLIINIWILFHIVLKWKWMKKNRASSNSTSQCC